MSEIDSDCDDVFTDDSKGTLIKGGDGCHVINRKRRRGIIEKRRRDRINNSLSELRRLVPSAFEKQGSAKLEKAEILQMTVDHLRILHTKGLDPFGFEPHQQLSMDYHGVGFRECAAEVARYLVGMEGMDLQDPLRMRLLSHLQCFAAQRDLAIKTPSSPWSPLFSSLTVTPTAPHFPQPSVASPLPERAAMSSFSGYSSTSSEARLSRPSSSSSALSCDMVVTSSPTSMTPVLPSLSSSSPSMPKTHERTSVVHSTSIIGNSYSSRFSSNPHQPAAVRPYRPWGAELAY